VSAFQLKKLNLVECYIQTMITPCTLPIESLQHCN